MNQNLPGRVPYTRVRKRKRAGVRPSRADVRICSALQPRSRHLSAIRGGRHSPPGGAGRAFRPHGTPELFLLLKTRFLGQQPPRPHLSRPAGSLAGAQGSCGEISLSACVCIYSQWGVLCARAWVGSLSGFPSCCAADEAPLPWTRPFRG